jgi:hypothetical protein
MSKPFDISAIDDAALNHYRLITDPIADDTISQIIGAGFEKQISQVFMTLVTNEGINASTFSEFDSGLADIVTQYFEQTSQLPSWADTSMIKTAEKVFSLYGPEIFMLLNVSSLPMCYTCAKGAQVLYDTGRLMSHNKDIDPLARRLMETAQMIVNVMSPGGMAPGGSGIVTMQKIRLIHASVRYYLRAGKHGNPTWDVTQFGEPINQEDLTGTLMSFGPVILSGLKHLEVDLSPLEVDAYMHFWKVVGAMMGIQEPLLPETYADGFALASKILVHQADESEAGIALTKSCIDFINYILPGNTFDDLPSYFIDYFLQDFSTSTKKDLSKCIGVTAEGNRKDKIILSISRYFIGELSHLEHKSLIQQISPVFNKALLKGIIHHYNGGKNVHFFIPPALQKDWKLTEEWTDHKVIVPDVLGNRLSWQKKKQTLK